MKLLFVGGEAVPYISTGGLGDVLGSLPPTNKSFIISSLNHFTLR